MSFDAGAFAACTHLNMRGRTQAEAPDELADDKSRERWMLQVGGANAHAIMAKQ